MTRQALTAASDGANAVQSAIKYLRGLNNGWNYRAWSDKNR
jgi:thioredoxin reductase